MTTINTTTTAIANLIDATFVPASLSREDIVAVAKEGVDHIIAGDNKMQHAAYASLWQFLTHRNTDTLRILTASFSNAGGSFNKSRYDNIRYWVSRFFTEAGKLGIIEPKKTPLVFKAEQGDFDFTAKITVEVNKTSEGKRVVDMPDTNSEEYTALTELLHNYANTMAVSNATNAMRKEKNDQAVAEGKLTTNQKAAKAEENKRLIAAKAESLTEEEKVAKAEAEKELVEKTVKTTKKSLEKVAELVNTMSASDMLVMIEELRKVQDLLATKHAEKVAAATAAIAE